MAVNLPEMGALAPVPGIRVGSAAAGVRYSGRDDLALFELAPGTTVGGIFTRSAFRAPPVTVAASRLGRARGLVVNSGNANAATGEVGLRDAEQSCALAAAALGCRGLYVLRFSRGVMGLFLPLDGMAAGVTDAAAALAAGGWEQAARAIMTTDTAPKGVSGTFDIGGHRVSATAIIKGSGMIRPDMATMLAFLGTDAALSEGAVQSLARDLGARSFNRLTIDGDTSTNDAFVVAATGRSGTGDEQYDALLAALTPLVVELAERTVRDGEGATRFVTIVVEGGASDEECLQVAYAVAHSPLVKTALFAGDPNWGRFCMAIGKAGVEGLEPDRVSLDLDDVRVAENGLVAPSYTEAAGAAVMRQDEFTVRIGLGRGDCRETVWTSDLSYDYVRINAEYRT
ncbi:MAG: bifunctional glutamate N-acetyltransferase/amino-acid acetyltransferase ArgJ [Gammaproteobacteria bacterium]|nr:bifunctional glutamate N-acetyltransferase/amino-acid acetyltransferase ArgJ [Gammaproteobacteria bacterium]